MDIGTHKRALAVVAVFILVVFGVWWYLGFTFDFSRFFAATPTQSPIVTTTQVPLPTLQPVATLQVPPPEAVACAPATQTVRVNVIATLTASSGQGTYSWFAPGGVLSAATGTTVTVKYATVGTKEVTVQATRKNGPNFTDSVACAVTVTP